MRKIERTKKFKGDFKSIMKQKYFDSELFEEIVQNLANDIPLDEQYRDHGLHGKYEGARECHIKPNWLLVYSKTENGLRLILMRTGSHSDLFGK